MEGPVSSDKNYEESSISTKRRVKFAVPEESSSSQAPLVYSCSECQRELSLDEFVDIVDSEVPINSRLCCRECDFKYPLLHSRPEYQQLYQKPLADTSRGTTKTESFLGRSEESYDHNRFRLSSLLADLQSPTLDAPVPLGLVSKLYPYQRRTAASMLASEEERVVMGAQFVGDGRAAVTRGGILGEEMGAGKTIICISLILATVNTMCGPPKHIPLEKCFPVAPTKEISASKDCSEEKSLPPGAVRSLRELSAQAVLSRVERVDLSELPLDLKEYLFSPPPFYVSLEREIPALRAKSKRLPTTASSRVFLSRATLIVVPPTLLDQWVMEFNKHVEAGFLDIVVLRDNDTFPPPETLLMKHVVIVTNRHLSKAAQIEKLRRGALKLKQNGLKLGLGDELSVDLPSTPLHEIRWLRVIVDEGHIMGTDSNRAIQARNLHAERRWICSGTPTPNTSLSDELSYLFGLLRFLCPDERLNKKIWQQQIVNPLQGNKESGRKLLLDILSTVMLRTRLPVMNSDVQLPPLSVKVIPLGFTAAQVAIYNQHILLIRSNLLLSRFEGPDSFLHANNRKFASEALRNLRESCFTKDPIDKAKLENVEFEIYKDLSGEKVKTPSLLPEQRFEMEALYDRVRFYQSYHIPREIGLPAKLEYLNSRLLALTPVHKCIIFTQFPSVLMKVADMIDASRISFVEYHDGMRASERSSNINTFNTSEKCRVILMRTHLAAYGINLTAATFVFILDPILDNAQERQAIARAYRLGQTLPVTVEKLIISQSVEELMISLSESDGINDEGKTQRLLQSLKMIDHPSEVPHIRHHPFEESAIRSHFADWFERVSVLMPKRSKGGNESRLKRREPEEAEEEASGAVLNDPRHACPLVLMLGYPPDPHHRIAYFTCDGCGTAGRGLSYHCKEHKFDLHTFCVGLTQTPPPPPPSPSPRPPPISDQFLHWNLKQAESFPPPPPPTRLRHRALLTYDDVDDVSEGSDYQAERPPVRRRTAARPTPPPVLGTCSSCTAATTLFWTAPLRADILCSNCIEQWRGREGERNADLPSRVEHPGHSHALRAATRTSSWECNLCGSQFYNQISKESTKINCFKEVTNASSTATSKFA